MGLESLPTGGIEVGAEPGLALELFHRPSPEIKDVFHPLNKPLKKPKWLVLKARMALAEAPPPAFSPALGVVRRVHARQHHLCSTFGI